MSLGGSDESVIFPSNKSLTYEKYIQAIIFVDLFVVNFII